MDLGAPFEPLLKKYRGQAIPEDKHREEPAAVTEHFVDESQSRSITGSVFIGVTLMIFAMLFTLLFYWSYNKDVSLFVAILCGFVFLYTIMNVIVFVVKRESLGPVLFRITLGSTVVMAFLSIVLIIFFALKVRSGTSSSSNSSYGEVARPAYADYNQDQ